MWEMFLRGYLFPRWSNQLNQEFGGPLSTFNPAVITTLGLLLLIVLIKKKLILFVWLSFLTAWYWLPSIFEAKTASEFSAAKKTVPEGVKPGQLATADSTSLKIDYEYKSQYLWRGYELTVPQETTVNFGSYYYPGWEVWLDSRPLPLQSPTGSIISFTLPEVKKPVLLEIVFRQSAVQLVAEYLSIGAVLAALVYFGYGLSKKTA